MTPLRFHHPSGQTSPPGSEKSFDPEQYFIGLLRRAATGQLPNTLFSHKTLGEILIEPAQRRYSSSVSNLKEWCLLPTSEFKIKLNPEAALPGNGKKQMLEDLLWTAAYHASQGRMLDGCTAHDVVILTHWPNLSRIPSTPDCMRLSALLSRRPHAIDESCQLLDVSEGEAYSFYSAGICSGALKLVSRPPIPVAVEVAPEPTHVSHQSLTLRSLWRRLTGKH